MFEKEKFNKILAALGDNLKFIQNKLEESPKSFGLFLIFVGLLFSILNFLKIAPYLFVFVGFAFFFLKNLKELSLFGFLKISLQKEIEEANEKIMELKKLKFDFKSYEIVNLIRDKCSAYGDLDDFFKRYTQRKSFCGSKGLKIVINSRA